LNSTVALSPPAINDFKLEGEVSNVTIESRKPLSSCCDQK
jgi:hypothetical protein